MAVVLANQGNYAEAMEYYQKDLAITVKALGEDHADVGMTYNSMAMVLRKQGKHAEAEPLLRDTLAAQKRVLGDDHPHTLALQGHERPPRAGHETH